MDFCRDNDILCQGRGSAANSAVCFALGITNVDAVRFDLLFERFLAPARDGPPDIDLDIESDRREEVIQYVYERYDRRHAAQVANVITYRARSAVRDMARALGYSPGQQDAWSKQIDRWGPLKATVDETTATSRVPVLELAAQLEDFPRHLGIHSGGMVICDRAGQRGVPGGVGADGQPHGAAVGQGRLRGHRPGEVRPARPRHALRAALRDRPGRATTTASTSTWASWTSTTTTSTTCCSRADSVGVFQVESRAQMATLPRLKPRKFYDLVVEVALIRPGPIQGGSVHPYIRRRNESREVAPTTTRCWRTRWRRPTACRCSRNS